MSRSESIRSVLYAFSKQKHHEPFCQVSFLCDAVGSLYPGKVNTLQDTNMLQAGMLLMPWRMHVKNISIWISKASYSWVEKQLKDAWTLQFIVGYKVFFTHPISLLKRIDPMEEIVFMGVPAHRSSDFQILEAGDKIVTPLCIETREAFKIVLQGDNITVPKDQELHWGVMLEGDLLRTI